MAVIDVFHCSIYITNIATFQSLGFLNSILYIIHGDKHACLRLT